MSPFRRALSLLTVATWMIATTTIGQVKLPLTLGGLDGVKPSQELLNECVKQLPKDDAETSCPTPTVTKRAALVTLTTAEEGALVGWLKLTQADPNAAVTLEGMITGLSEGNHAIHVHVNGDIGNKCANAGGHFNPLNAASHGGPSVSVHHAGDLGNVKLNKQYGKSPVSLSYDYISLQDGNVANIMNRAIVIHASADTQQSTPSYGSMIACGKIEQIYLG